MAQTEKPGLIDRTLSQLRDTWRDVAASTRIAVTGAVRPDLPDDDAARLKLQIVACLEGRGGEVSARARAADLGRVYLTLDDTGRARFLGMLAGEFAANHGAVDAAIAAVQAASDEAARQHAEADLRRALMPPWQRLLTGFNALPEGVKFLVDLRADIIRIGKGDAALARLETDLKDLLASWFDIGFLDLKRITWDAPATLLEKLIAYEAVHEIRSWDDMKNRLDPDRRCFAFFHPRMPSEPLIFVEVALVDGMAGNIAALLDQSAPAIDAQDADTAIFYSISNAQRGLAGISFGDFLIKRVVDDLAAELKGLKTFATLSPIPGFRDWLDGMLAADGAGPLAEADAKALVVETGAGDSSRALRALLDMPWHEGEGTMQLLKQPLMKLCARYLLREKRDDGRPLDPVARFHLSNGARIARINWLGDTSSKGLAQSAGMMVNYVYKLGDIEENHEAYSDQGKVVAASSVRSLARRERAK